MYREKTYTCRIARSLYLLEAAQEKNLVPRVLPVNFVAMELFPVDHLSKDHRKECHREVQTLMALEAR